MNVNLIQYVNALATVIVGSIAFMIYVKQKFDSKKDAASIILLEIKNAEPKIVQANNSLANNPPYLANIATMPNQSWDKYGYLFVGDFKPNEWEKVSNFYNKCRLHDEAVEYNNSFFSKNEQEVRINTQRVIADYSKEYLDKIQKVKNNTTKQKMQLEMQFMINQFINEYRNVNVTNGNAFYAPQKPINDARSAISNLDTDISTSSVGIKLENINAHPFLYYLISKLPLSN
jgi:hypothetical protein